MITYVNSKNTAAYSLLYSQVTELLRTHDQAGRTAEEAGAEFIPVLTREEVKLTKDAFIGYEETLYETKDSTDEIVTSNQNAKILWDDAGKDGSEEITFFQAESIDSLNELFGHLADIAKAEPRYTRLPIDEDLFDIDLNTRVITVPDSFKKNGISVKGDEMAEIVYFRVRRYYDAADLYGDLDTAEEPDKQMKIYIQWETTEKDANGKAVQGVSMPYIIDAVSEPDYVIFGWPISSSITKVSGDVKFSVRFYKYENGEITYSLSTLTSTVSVKAGLDYDLEYIQEDNDGTFIVDRKTQAIIERFVNSVINNNEITVPIPVFAVGITTLNHMGHDLNDNAVTIANYIDEKGVTQVTTDLGINENTGYLSEPIMMYVQAKTDGDGSLTYFWKKFDLEDTAEKFNEKSSTIMMKTKDTSNNTTKAYYYYAGNDTSIAYSLVPSDWVFAEEKDDDGNKTGNIIHSGEKTIIYERYSQMKFDSVGKYYAVATNRIHTNSASTRTPDNTKDTDGTIIYHYCVIPRPHTPSFKTPLPVHAYLDAGTGVDAKYGVDLKAETNDTKDHGKVTYLWEYKAAGTDEFIPLDVDAKGLVRLDGEEDTGVYHVEGDAEYATTDEEGHGLTINGPACDTDTKFALGDGIYRVTITNHLNRFSSEWAEKQPSLYKDATEVSTSYPDGRPAVCTASNDVQYNAEEAPEGCISYCRVTHLPSKPHVNRVGEQKIAYADALNDHLKVELEMADDGVTPKNEVENGEQHIVDEDSYTYQWYRYIRWNEKTAEEDAEDAEKGLYDFVNGGDTLIEGATSAEFVPTGVYTYYCVVTNNYNGKTAAQCSPFFVLMDVNSAVAADGE